METTRYSIIFAGSGLSGLTLALELLRYPQFGDAKILLIDRDDKTRNDRTWCFWAPPTIEFPTAVSKTWDRCLFFGENFESVLDLAPYRYHMVRGADFYRWAKTTLQRYPNVTFLQASINHIDPETGKVATNQGDFWADWIMDSAFSIPKLLPPASTLYPHPPFTERDQILSQPKRRSEIRLLQHFKGWIIETQNAVFDPSVATLMDYRIEQGGDTRFMYVLPFSEHRALVEFTVFSPTLCSTDTYDDTLRGYLQKWLKISDYQIVESEFGVIPMTNADFGPLREGRVWRIGTNAGFVKASSGYAFTRTLKKLRAFAKHWAENGQPDAAPLATPYKYRFLDSVFLNVLDKGEISGKTVFSALFQNLPAPEVFRFLDEEGTLWQDLRVIRSVPTIPFLRAAWRNFIGK